MDPEDILLAMIELAEEGEIEAAKKLADMIDVEDE